MNRHLSGAGSQQVVEGLMPEGVEKIFVGKVVN
jgi:hypothetical protein